MSELDLAPLFEPVRIGPLALRNRFAMPAMQIGYVADNGPTPKMIEHLRARAEGGVGLVFSESCAPDHPSSYWQPVFCVMNARTRDGWGRVVEAEGRRVSAVGGITTAAEPDVPLVEAEARFARLRPDQAGRLFVRLASPDAANPDVAHD